MADRKHYEGRRAIKYEGGSFKADNYPEGISETDFVNLGVKNGTFAKQTEGDEEKQRNLLRGLYTHLYGKKNAETQQVDESYGG